MDYYHIATRKFCCCLPVRLGVFVLSIVSALLSGMSAYGLWYTVIQTARKGTVDDDMATGTINWTPADYQNATLSSWQQQLNTIALDKQQYYAFIVIGIVTTLYCLFSIFGFVGTLFAKRALVAFYSTALWFSLVINFLLGCYSVWSVVHRRQSIVDECVAQTANNNTSTVATDENKLTSAVCSAASKAGVAVAIVLFIVQWLIQLYECIIVKRYLEQLSEEQGYRRHTAGNRISKGGDAGGYYAHEPLVSHHEMMPPPGPYPYSDKAHSYGNKA